MPLIIVQYVRAIIFNTNASVAEVDNINDVSVDKFNGKEVLMFSSIVHDQASHFQSLEPERDANIVISSELR